MPGYLCFGELTVFSTKGCDHIKNKMAYYGLLQDEPRVNFDPKGFMSSEKQSQKLRSYENVPLVQEDLIKNLSEAQDMDKLEAYDKVIRDKEWKNNRNLLKTGVYLDIQDLVTCTNKKIIHLDEVIEGVPPSVLDRDTRNPLGRNVQFVIPLLHMSPQPTPSIQSDRVDIQEQDPSHVPKGDEVFAEAIVEREDIRQLAGENFISDDEFIHSQEFTTFLYK